MSSLAARIEEKNAVATALPHVMINARAGTGKTTTLICALQRMKGEIPGVDVPLDSDKPEKGTRRVRIKPDAEQEAVWDEIARSKEAGSVCFAAFGREIADVLKKRVPNGCNATTLHSMGLRVVSAAHPELPYKCVHDERYLKTRELTAKVLGRTLQELRRNETDMLKAIEELVSKCKANLVYGQDFDELQALASHYNIDGVTDDVLEIVPRVLDASTDLKAYPWLDYDDMVYLPIRLDLKVFQNDLLLVDEAQDLTPAQREIAIRAGRRLIFCGDPNQAIFAFAGADSDSMEMIASRLEKMPQSCIQLSMTTTYRCGKAIVKEAQRYVPDIQAAEGNGEGKVSNRILSDNFDRPGNYRSWVEDGDLVLCRRSAPLVSECLWMLANGRKAVILGRDMGTSLANSVRSARASSIPHLIEKLNDVRKNQVAIEKSKKHPSTERLQAINDRFRCLLALSKEASSVADVLDKIGRVFSEHKNGIQFSTIHKAKGLEARKVCLIETPDFKNGKTHDQAQELNLRYVAITRAIDEFVYVNDRRGSQYSEPDFNFESFDNG